MARRFVAYAANVRKILEHNARAGVSYTLGLNAHADLTTDEFRLRFFGSAPLDLLEVRAAAEAAAVGAAVSDEETEMLDIGEKPFPYSHVVPPASVDWREKGIVTPVKNQHVNNSKCGCCFAFGGGPVG
jgi:hypothetical protein